MTARPRRVPFALDPLVAEARRRARQRRALVVATVVVAIGAVAGATLAFRLGHQPAAATKPTGTIFGGIVRGGTHFPSPGNYVAGTVTVSSTRGGAVATVNVLQGSVFRLRLQRGVYVLTARYIDEPCTGRIVVRPQVTRRADVICEGK
jgi:hypothetical protein